MIRNTARPMRPKPLIATFMETPPEVLLEIFRWGELTPQGDMVTAVVPDNRSTVSV